MLRGGQMMIDNTRQAVFAGMVSGLYARSTTRRSGTVVDAAMWEGV
jgi:hypothetical protein